jgi:Tfp pilus assembly protein PilV
MTRQAPRHAARPLVAAPARVRGITLVEALVAFAIMAVGLLGLIRAQAGLRLEADVTRQRAEAVRVAQEDLERLRAYATTEEFDASVVATGPTEVSTLDANTTYTLTRVVDDAAAPAARLVSVTVAWTDRRGQSQSLTLRTLIGRADPALAGQLAAVPAANAVSLPFNRSVQIPATAIDLGGGRSGFRPPGLPTDGSGDVYFVLDNTAATVIEKCSGLPEAYASTRASGGCTTLRGSLLSGFVSFDLRSNISAINPGSTVCEFHRDLQDAGLIGSTAPTLDVARLRPDPWALMPRWAGAVQASAVALAPTGNPADGTAGVAPTQNLTISFTSTTLSNVNSLEFVSASTIELRVRGGAMVESFAAGSASTSNPQTGASGSTGGSIGVSGASIVVDPGAALSSGTVYELVIPSGTLRLKKNPASYDTYSGGTVTFSTGTGPTLGASVPTAGGEAASLSASITLNFDRPVYARAGVVTLYKRGNGNAWSPVESFNVVGGAGGSGGTLSGLGTATLTLDPAADLVPGAEYSLQIEPAALVDANGISHTGITDHTTLGFLTSSSTSPGSGSCPTAATVKPFLGVTLAVTGNGGTALQWECYTDAATAATLGTEFVAGYFCAVYTPGTGAVKWNGTARLTGPQGWLAGAQSRYRVCRYHDSNGNGTDDSNAEHPANYTQVDGPLSGQNYLVIRKDRDCPDDTLNVGSQTGLVIHYNTSLLQP